MTQFFEFQRNARWKSKQVLGAFVLLLFLLFYIFNFFMYQFLAMQVNAENRDRYRNTPVAYYGKPAAEPPKLKDPSFVQKTFYLHPQRTAIQVSFFVFFMALFGGGFLYQFVVYRTRPQSVVRSMVYKPVIYHINNTAKEKQLMNIVEEMCIAAGIPVVKTFVLLNEHGINAFTAGHDIRTAHIVVTQGALDKLNREEMQAVVAHEVGHIVSADVHLNTLLLSCIFSLTFITTLGIKILRGSSNRSSSSGRGGGGQILLVAAILVLVGYLGSVGGRVLQSMFSRRREYLADSLGVQFTRNPSALASALAKIRDNFNSEIQHYESINISHMCIASSYSRRFFDVFSSHPPVDDRIRLLDKRYLKPHPDVVDAYKKAMDESSNLNKTSKKMSVSQNGINIPGLDPIFSSAATAAVLGHFQNEKIEQVMHQPEKFKYGVWALFISDQSDVKKRQFKILEDIYGEGFSSQELQDCLLTEDKKQNVANSVVAVALPQVQSLPKSECKKFLDSIQKIITVDQHLSAFEHIIYSCFSVMNQPEKDNTRLNLNHIRRLLFMCSQVSSSDISSKLKAYHDAIAQYWGPSYDLSKDEPEGLDLSASTHLLQQIRSRASDFKREILAAVGVALASDGKIEPQEYEIYRALSIALDVPAPPLKQ